MRKKQPTRRPHKIIAISTPTFELLNMTRTPQDCTLVVTAMSELRLEYLRSFLREVAGDLLIAPVIKSKPVEVFDKNGMKKRSVLAPRRN